FWASGNLAGRRHDRLHYCGVCWGRNSGVDFTLAEKSLNAGRCGAARKFHRHSELDGGVVEERPFTHSRSAGRTRAVKARWKSGLAMELRCESNGCMIV